MDKLVCKEQLLPLSLNPKSSIEQNVVNIVISGAGKERIRVHHRIRTRSDVDICFVLWQCDDFSQSYSTLRLRIVHTLLLLGATPLRKQKRKCWYLPVSNLGSVMLILFDTGSCSNVHRTLRDDTFKQTKHKTHIVTQQIKLFYSLKSL